MHLKSRILIHNVLFFSFFLISTGLYAVNYTSAGSGNWAAAATWSPAGVPTAADNVTILSGHNVTMNGNPGACLSLTINGTATWTQNRLTRVGAGGVIIPAAGNIAGAGAGRLQTRGGFSNNAVLTNNAIRIQIVTTNGQSISGTGSVARLAVNVTATNNGTLTVRIALSGTSTLTNAGGQTINIGGTSTVTNLIATSVGNTVNYNGAAAQTVKATTYYNLSITKPVAITATINANITVNNNLTVTSGTLAIGAVTFVNNGAASVTSISGTLQFTSNAGSRTFKDIIVNAGGTWQASAVINFTITGNFTNNGTFTSNTGVYTFSGAGKTISGSSATSISALLCSGSYTNNGNVTVTVNLTGAGSWVQGSTGILNLRITNANFTVTTFNASAAGNTVNYTLAGNQNVRNGVGSTYHHLGIAGTGIKTLVANVIVNGNLTISSTLDVTAANFNITLGGNWSNTGTFNPRGGAATVTLNGTAQSITKAGGETFNHLTCAGSGIKTLGSAITANGTLTINAGSTLDVSVSNFALNVKRNFSNSGTFTAQGGTVTLNGAVAQTVNGTTITTFSSLALSNAAGASLGQDAKLSGTLTLTSGNFTTTGKNFTLLSDVNGTARIAAIPAAGNITGNIIMQRYINSTATSWRQIGPAVSGRTIAEWNDNFYMSGFPGSNNPSFNFCSVYTYDETKPGVKDTGWTKPANITDAVPLGKGILAYIGPVPLTMDVAGPPGKFVQNFSITYTNTGSASDDGWNLISNPYPSSIDWDALTWTKTNINNAVYIWNPSLQQYSSYISGVGTNGGSNIIPSSQGFWIQTNNAAPVLKAVENVKSAIDQGFMKVSQQMMQQIYNLTIDVNGNNLSDQTAIRFDANATPGFDPNYDAYKFSGDPGTPYLASVINGNTDLSINSIPSLTNAVTIPVRLKVAVTGSYTLKKDTLSNLPSSSCIVLEDRLTGTFTDLRNFNSYTFNISDTTNAPRFLIHVGAPITKQSIAARCFGASNGKAIAGGAGSGPWTYVWKNSSNVILRTTTNSIGADTLQNIPAGIYTVEVTDVNSICGMTSDTFQVTQPAQLTENSVIDSITCNGMNNGMISPNAGGGNMPYTYSWSNGSSGSFIGNLAPGNYLLRITDANGCIDSASYVLTQPAPIISSFSESNDTAFLSQQGMIYFTNASSGAANYQWFFNDGTMTDTVVNPVHYYDSTGTHVVMLIASKGNCSDTSYFSMVVFNDTASSSHTGIGSNVNSNNVTTYNSGNGTSIVFDLSERSCVEISLRDALGRQVLNTETACVKKETVELNTTQLARGIYYLRISDGKRFIVKKIFL